ncbi:MAG: hypothetical protein KAJ81_04015 [Candidatus Latescibacteria bacterium]|nr:hypothetical protein [Candidatus Latescibacterota bacterium]
MRKHIFMALWCFALCLCASVPTEGSFIFMSFEFVPFEEMVQEADLIVIGKVADITCRRIEDANIFIRTYVTFEVEETMKGTSAGDVIVIEFEGGAVKKPDSDEYVVISVSDTPSFFVGNRDVLFLRISHGHHFDDKPVFYVAGAFGKYGIAGDKAVPELRNGFPEQYIFDAWKEGHPEESEESYQAWQKSFWPTPDDPKAVPLKELLERIEEISATTVIEQTSWGKIKGCFSIDALDRNPRKPEICW